MKRGKLTDERIRDVLLPFGVALDVELCQAVRAYTETLLRWNEKISLTSVTDPDQIIRIHFGESFFAASLARIADRRIADIGSGAGFPGIAIRMVRPDAHLTLVEPVAKKTAFLSEILRKLSISNAKILRSRMEDLPTDICFDLITARALGKYDSFLRESRARISQTGSVMLLVGESEANQIGQKDGWTWRDPVRIPESTARFVLLGSLR